MKLKDVMEELGVAISTNQSAVTSKSGAYQKSMKRFKANLLAMNYEDINKKKKKRKKK